MIAPNGRSGYLSEALSRVGILRRCAPSRLGEFATEAEAAVFLHNVTGLGEIAAISDPYDRVIKVPARIQPGVCIDVYLP